MEGGEPLEDALVVVGVGVVVDDAGASASRICQAVTMSFIRWSRARNASSAGLGAVETPGGLLLGEERCGTTRP